MLESKFYSRKGLELAKESTRGDRFKVHAHGITVRCEKEKKPAGSRERPEKSMPDERPTSSIRDIIILILGCKSRDG